MIVHERRALTRKLRGRPGTSRGNIGLGQRPKFAPASPGCVTSASQPWRDNSLSGSFVPKRPGAPSRARAACSGHATREKNSPLFITSNPRRLPVAVSAPTFSRSPCTAVLVR